MAGLYNSRNNAQPASPSGGGLYNSYLNSNLEKMKSDMESIHSTPLELKQGLDNLAAKAKGPSVTPPSTNNNPASTASSLAAIQHPFSQPPVKIKPSPLLQNSTLKGLGITQPGPGLTDQDEREINQAHAVSSAPAVLRPLISGLNKLANVTQPFDTLAQEYYTPGAGASALESAAKGAEAGLARVAPGLTKTLLGKVAQKAITGAAVGAPVGAGQTLASNPGASGKEIAANAALGAGMGLAEGAGPLVKAGIQKGVNALRPALEGLTGARMDALQALERQKLINGTINPDQLALPAPRQRGNLNGAITPDVIRQEETGPRGLPMPNDTFSTNVRAMQVTPQGLPMPRMRGNANGAFTPEVIQQAETGPRGLPEPGGEFAQQLQAHQDAMKGIDEVNSNINDLQMQRQQAINDTYKYLKESRDTRGGKTKGGMNFDESGKVIGKIGWESNNPQWYRDFYAEHGKVPSNKDLYKLATKYVDEGETEGGVNIPSWKSENQYDETMASLNQVKDELNKSVMQNKPVQTDALLKDVRAGRNAKMKPAPITKAAVQYALPAPVRANPLAPNKTVTDAVLKDTIAARKPFTGKVAKPALAQAEPTAVPANGVAPGANQMGRMAPEAMQEAAVASEAPQHTPAIDHEQADEAEFQDAAAEEDKRNWFTTLFGKRGVGISPFGGGDLKEGVQQQIVDNPIKTDVKGVLDAVTNGAKQSYYAMADAIQPLKDHFGEEAYNIAMDANRAANLANQSIHGDNFVDLQGVRRGRSLKSVMKLVPRGLDRDAIAYLTLRDAESRVGRGEMVYEEKHNMDTAENVQAKLKEYEKRFKWAKKFGSEWDKFTSNIRKYYGLEGDLINKAQNAAMIKERPHYVPQRRQFNLSEKIKQTFGKKGRGFTGRKAPIHEASETGSRRKIVDPRRTIIEATQQWVENAMMNRVMVHLGDMAHQNPEAWDGILNIVRDVDKTAPKYAHAFADAEELQKAVNSGDTESYMEALTKQFQNLFKAKSGDDHVLTYMKKGQPVKIRIGNVDAVKALASLVPQQQGPMMRFLDFNSHLIKQSATGILSPLFAAKQLTVDLPQALIQSERPIQHFGNFIHALASSAVDTFPGLNRTKLANLAKSYKEAGGEFSMIKRTDKGLNKSLAGLKRNAILSPKGVAQGVKTGVKLPFTALHKFGDIFENVNRMAAAKPYLNMERTAKNVRDAMNVGREATVNYARRGSLYNQIEGALPYTNAAIQSVRKFIMTFAKNPVKATIGMTALVLLPKLYEYSQFGNDQDYKNLPARTRYRNLIIAKKANGKFVQIPMPQEYEAVGAFMEDLYRKYVAHDQDVINGNTADAMLNAYTPSAVTGLMQGVTQKTGAEGSLAGFANATSLAPLAGVLANKSFTGAPIVPQRLSVASPRYQYDETTSAIGKKIGQLIGMSPMKVDYLLKAYGGDPTRLVAPIFSPLGLGTPKDVLLKNFIVDPVITNNLSNSYYTMKGKITQAEADNKIQGVPLPKWYDKGIASAMTSTAKGSITKQLSDLTSQKHAVQSDKTLSAAEKTGKIRNIQAQMNQIYLDAVTRMKGADIP